MHLTAALRFELFAQGHAAGVVAAEQAGGLGGHGPGVHAVTCPVSKHPITDELVNDGAASLEDLFALGIPFTEHRRDFLGWELR